MGNEHQEREQEEEVYTLERLEGFGEGMHATIILYEPEEFRRYSNDKKPKTLTSLTVEIRGKESDRIRVFPYIPQGWRQKPIKGYGADVLYTNLKNIEHAKAPQ